MKHLCKTLYRDFIHRFIEPNSKNVDVQRSVKEILATSRFYQLGRPGESSAYILYYFRLENDLPLENFISDPNALPDNVKNIVFVDDVTLSEGVHHSQAYSYLESAVSNYFRGKKIILITFIATTDAKSFLEQKGIDVISCIVLDKRHKCFATDSNVFYHFIDHRMNCKRFAEYYGKKVNKKNPLGFKDGQFMFGFFYNTPDNTLPIFWSHNNGWKPVIKRYDKKHLKEPYALLERFI